MAQKTIKCAWCGKVVTLTKNGQRPQQHQNGNVSCVGSGQLASTHERIHAANPDTLKPQTKKR